MRGLFHPGEVGKPPDLMNSNLIGSVTDLTHAPQKALNDFAVRVWEVGTRSKGTAFMFRVRGIDPAEPCDQWLPTLPLNRGLEACSQPVRGPNLGLLTGRHLRHRGSVLRCQGPQHRDSHDPFEPVEPVNVAGEQVVLDEPSVFGFERGDDGVVILVHQVGAIVIDQLRVM